MTCGLFGKIPGKRDFLALNAPAAVLSVYEPWLQGSLTASRLALGARWRDVFLQAPLWRFWLGQAHCGCTVAGAFMPSIDGSGRYFPLTVLSTAGPGVGYPPPELDPQDAWYAGVEAFLLAALEPDATFEAVRDALYALPDPRDGQTPAPPSRMTRLSDGAILSALEPGDFPARLGALRIEDHARAYAHAVYFWTMGGESFEPLVLVGQALPAPHLFAGLLSGRFDNLSGDPADQAASWRHARADGA